MAGSRLWPMNRFVVVSVLALLLTIVGVTAVAIPMPQTDVARQPAEASIKTVTIPIEGMVCQEMCGSLVAKTLKAVDGVREVVVTAAGKNARVTYVQAKVAPQRFVEEINKLGFKAGSPKVSQ